MNRPTKGCGGADKLLCGLAGVTRLLASTRTFGFLQLRPGSAGWAPGIPDVLGWNLWWHLSAGISAYGDIHPSVWHDGTGRSMPASCLPTRICLSERCWKLCFRLSGMMKKLRAGKHREIAVQSEESYTNNRCNTIQQFCSSFIQKCFFLKVWQQMEIRAKEKLHLRVGCLNTLWDS